MMRMGPLNTSSKYYTQQKLQRLKQLTFKRENNFEVSVCAQGENDKNPPNTCPIVD
jgi:hypothetical protein